LKDKNTSEKILWLLQHFNTEIEIIDLDDFHDWKLLTATRDEESMSFEEYVKNEN